MKLRTGIVYGEEQGVETLARLKRLGYSAIDYQDFLETPSALFTMDEQSFRSEMVRRRKAIEQAGLFVCQAHGPWRYPPRDREPSDVEEWFGYMSRAILGTGLLGCKYFVTHPVMPFLNEENPDDEGHIQANLAFYSRLEKVARENDVVICIENMPFARLCTSTPEQTLALVKRLDSPYFGVCLDTGHSHVLGISPADAVRQLGSRYLKVLHVHDNNATGDLHWLPYTGTIHWESFSRALGEIGFDGVVALETGIRKGENMPADISEKMDAVLAAIADRIAEV